MDPPDPLVQPVSGPVLPPCRVRPVTGWFEVSEAHPIGELRAAHTPLQTGCLLLEALESAATARRTQAAVDALHECTASLVRQQQRQQQRESWLEEGRRAGAQQEHEAYVAAAAAANFKTAVLGVARGGREAAAAAPTAAQFKDDVLRDTRWRQRVLAPCMELLEADERAGFLQRFAQRQKVLDADAKVYVAAAATRAAPAKMAPIAPPFRADGTVRLGPECASV